MRHYFFAVLIYLTFSCIIFAQEKGNIFPEGAKPEKVFGEGFFTEGPAEAPDGSIYFSDLTFTSESQMQAGYIWKYMPQTGKTVLFRSPSGMANGIVFDPQGNMLIAQSADFGLRCLTETDMKTGKSRIIAGLFNNKPFNSPNDLSLDKKGRIYFTDPRYTGHEKIEQPQMGVYRLDGQGKVSLIISEVSMPNGVATSPDGRTIYIGCYDEGNQDTSEGSALRAPKMEILAYDLKSDGSASLRKVLVKLPPEGGPDGMRSDEKGNLYVAIRNESAPSVKVYSPEGVEIESLNLPEVPSNMAFSRKGYLYITAGQSLYRIKTLNRGYFISK
ncbi:MAG TPA: SMP-30/gluconolactonase/LRE family protein [Ignavibacteriales bacterium]|nr:SMP-30/gluconolactonase/LRE family protein [Ignavibacteriales bacterium]